MKQFSVSTSISAAPANVWAILVDGPAWSGWNTTIDRLEGRIAPGEIVKLHVKLNPGRAFPVKVAEFTPPSRMVWRGGMPLGLFKGERVFTLSPQDAGTRFSMAESFSGPLSGLIGRSIPDMQPAFDEFAACLKARAESA